MKILRMLSWLIASLPIVAAGYWVSFAARMPEPLADRVALGEITPRWDFESWADATQEPMHVMARALHLGFLHLPESTVASVAWLSVVCAFLTVAALCGLLRRALFANGVSGLGGPMMFGVCGMLVASPVYGSDWLYGQRLGLFVVPMLFVYALKWLQANDRFVWRALLACMVAGIAPWFHLHGVIVATALIPALFSAASAANSDRRIVWICFLLLIGNVAAFFSLRTAAGISIGGVDWLGSLASDPAETVMMLLAATGDAWLDVWPESRFDEQLLGLLSWTMPLLLLRLGNRSAEACRSAAAWWSCLLFGLLIVVVTAVRYELQPPIGHYREVTFGLFLVPVGLIGLLGARFGRSMVMIAAGALFVLLLQDWRRGIEDLRLAYMRSEQAEAALLVPSDKAISERTLPVQSAEELAFLQDRGWVPHASSFGSEDLVAQFAAPRGEVAGGITGGDNQLIRGTVVSSLRLSTPMWLAIVAKMGDAEPTVIGRVSPSFAGKGREVAWKIDLSDALPNGARVRAVGLLVRDRKVVAFGPTFEVRNGKLKLNGDS